MLGLIFVTWEKYLTERFGSSLLNSYRDTIGETTSNSPLASRRYEDATLLAGVEAASQLTSVHPDTLLREYGRYFIINGLTGHLCTYILSQIHSGRDLLLAMRKAHARLRITFEGSTPPLFDYEISSNPNEVVLIYSSSRHLCSVLLGAIEGAAERYGERVQVVERRCMKQGAASCRFDARFFAPASEPQRYVQTPEQLTRQRTRKQLFDLMLSSLPDYGTTEGVTLADLQGVLQQKHANAHFLRPAVMLETINHLQFAGLIMSTANHAGDNLTSRRYWRIPASWQ